MTRFNGHITAIKFPNAEYIYKGADWIFFEHSCVDQLPVKRQTARRKHLLAVAVHDSELHQERYPKYYNLHHV